MIATGRDEVIAATARSMNEGSKMKLKVRYVSVRFRAVAVALGSLAAMAATSQPRVESLLWKRRVLILSAPSASDPALATQRRLLRGWEREAAGRDLTIVEVEGNAVRGAGDDAQHLRTRYRVPARAFAAVLVGKDGHVAQYSAKPISSGDLQGAIDAMPMRRAGER
jgi:hypothetical protein